MSRPPVGPPPPPPCANLDEINLNCPVHGDARLVPETCDDTAGKHCREIFTAWYDRCWAAKDVETMLGSISGARDQLTGFYQLCTGGAPAPPAPDMCGDLTSRAAVMNRECCDEPWEDCSSGLPAVCNAGCASVLLPFFADCSGSLGAAAATYQSVVAQCQHPVSPPPPPPPPPPSGCTDQTATNYDPVAVVDDGSCIAPPPPPPPPPPAPEPAPEPDFGPGVFADAYTLSGSSGTSAGGNLDGVYTRVDNFRCRPYADGSSGCDPGSPSTCGNAPVYQRGANGPTLFRSVSRSSYWHLASPSGLANCGGGSYGQLSSSGTAPSTPDDATVYNSAWLEHQPRQWQNGGWRELHAVPDMTIVAGAAPEPAPEPAPEAAPFADAYTVIGSSGTSAGGNLDGVYTRIDAAFCHPYSDGSSGCDAGSPSTCGNAPAYQRGANGPALFRSVPSGGASYWHLSSPSGLGNCGGDDYAIAASHSPDRSSLMVETVEGAPDDATVYDRAWLEHQPRQWQNGGWRELHAVPDMTIVAGAAPEPAPDPCAATPCANGGACTAVAGGSGHRRAQTAAAFTCSCVVGFSGDLCETPDPPPPPPPPPGPTCVSNHRPGGGQASNQAQSYLNGRCTCGCCGNHCCGC